MAYAEFFQGLNIDFGFGDMQKRCAFKYAFHSYENPPRSKGMGRIMETELKEKPTSNNH